MSRKSKANYYKGASRVMFGGCPCRVVNVPGSEMLRDMQRAATPSRAFDNDARDSQAVKYAQWIAARDGLAVPVVNYTNDGYGGTRARVLYEIPTGMEWSRANTRATSVIWERVGREARRGYRSNATPECVTLLTVEIPNWEHVPQCVDVSEPVARVVSASFEGVAL